MPIEPDWGHPLFGPNGEELRVPLWAYIGLHKLGVKKRYSLHLSHAVYDMIDPAYDSLTDGLRHLLGCDLDGPAWLVCHCRQCKRREGENDNTPLPGRQRSELAAEAAINDMRRVGLRLRGAEGRLLPRPRDARKHK